MDVPLTFLIDDILRPMAINQKNYFKLNKGNAKDSMDHLYDFDIGQEDIKTRIRKYNYIDCRLKQKVS